MSKYHNLIKIIYHDKLKEIPKILETPYVEKSAPYKYEIEMIRNKKFNPNLIDEIPNYKANNKTTGLVVLWVKLRKAGYTRSVTSLYRMLIKLKIYNINNKKNWKREPSLFPKERISYDRY